MRATGKPFNIDKKLVYEAYKAVKSNGGAAGVDRRRSSSSKPTWGATSTRSGTG